MQHTRRVPSLSLALLLALVGSSALQAQTGAGAEPRLQGAATTKPRHHRASKAAARARAQARAENAARRDVQTQPERLLKGIKLTPAQKTQRKAIRKGYEAQLEALRKDEKATAKAGLPTTDYVAKITALRDQERADLRSMLTPTQQARFDANIARRASRH
jgi:hypothetical protein